MLSFDEVIAFVGQRPHLGFLAIDGLPLAGKPPWPIGSRRQSKVRASFSTTSSSPNVSGAGATGRGITVPASAWASMAWCAGMGR